MADKSPRKIFVNLAVRDLKKSMEFFTKLGFGFDPKFTDDKAACMIISEEAYVMLLGEPFFKTFTRRELCDTTKDTEALLRALVRQQGGGGRHGGQGHHRWRKA